MSVLSECFRNHLSCLEGHISLCAEPQMCIRDRRVREVEKLIMCETKEKGSSRKSYGHTNVLVDMMQNYPGFMDYIAYQYPLEGERIELLEQILTALAVGRKLEAEQMIYHYGSMIHGRDLIEMCIRDRCGSISRVGSENAVYGFPGWYLQHVYHRAGCTRQG